MAGILGGAADIQDAGERGHIETEVLRAGHVPVPQVRPPFELTAQRKSAIPSFPVTAAGL